jgi:DNA-binding MarR family transcriptional regulator
MLINDTDRGFGFLLTETSRLFRKLIDRRLHPLGLTRAQWSVLAIVSNRDGLSQSQLAEMLEIEKTTAGRLIDHVEKRGWIERRPIPGDRRLWGVCLTEQARPLIAEVERIVLSTRTEMLSGLSPEQQQGLSHALQAVKSNLSTALSVDQSTAATQESDEF